MFLKHPGLSLTEDVQLRKAVICVKLKVEMKQNN